MKTPGGKVNPIPGRLILALGALVTVLSVGACSEEKSPPDDENSSAGKSDGKLASFSEACGENPALAAEFRACALRVLKPYALTEIDANRLSGCGYAFERPESSPGESFERARFEIRVNCED